MDAIIRNDALFVHVVFAECQWGHVVEFPEAFDEVAWRVKTTAVGNVSDVFIRVGEDFLRGTLELYR